jgi:uncharacterized protein YprB with RNaseH-like and TPR domain
MLRHTFIHGRGIGPGTEAALWRAGVNTWDEYLDEHGAGRLPGRRYGALAPLVARSRKALAKREIGFFSRWVPSFEQWRLYSEFSGTAAYVDIETTGLSPYNDITVIAIHAQGATKTLVRGKDLYRFPAAVAGYPLVVTYNGALFDLPFLAREFGGWHPAAHIDLRYPLRRLGLTGGLKAIEERVGLKRPAYLRDVDGFEAVRLWRRYERGDRRALDQLLEYARYDVEHLSPLARLAASGLAAQLGFPSPRGISTR